MSLTGARSTIAILDFENQLKAKLCFCLKNSRVKVTLATAFMN
jgi:hypothetical protein